VQRVVLDTNQFVSSLLKKEGPSAQLLQAWRDRLYLLIVSPFILEEMKRVLSLPKIRKKYNVSSQDVRALISLLENEAMQFPATTPISVITADPSDNFILATALEGRADWLVSGDRHLLQLQSFRNIPIVTARFFLSQLSAAKSE